MKKRSVFAILMAVLFVGLTLNVFSDNTDNSGQTAGPGGDVRVISSSDVNGTFVPE
ncbi:MAG TPA: hypothetical protein VLN45_08650 [Ignavibacteriaceae bacterium]|nr:hypothetical protein [Ignavibacteriaceae bacterium]